MSISKSHSRHPRGWCQPRLEQTAAPLYCHLEGTLKTTYLPGMSWNFGNSVNKEAPDAALGRCLQGTTMPHLLHFLPTEALLPASASVPFTTSLWTCRCSLGLEVSQAGDSSEHMPGAVTWFTPWNHLLTHFSISM